MPIGTCSLKTNSLTCIPNVPLKRINALLLNVLRIMLAEENTLIQQSILNYTRIFLKIVMCSDLLTLKTVSVFIFLTQSLYRSKLDLHA